MLKIGDKVIVKGYTNPVIVSEIYQEDRAGKKTKWDFDTARVMIVLDWGSFGKSKVSITDENKYWHKYSEAN